MSQAVLDQTTKRCGSCGVEKPLFEFSKNRSQRDGLHHQCKTCNAEYNRQWAQTHPEESRAQSARWRKANPGKVRSRDERGILFRRQKAHIPEEIGNLRTGVCKWCGYQRKPGERQLDLHHTFYDEQCPWLWTIELCRKCHKAAHRHGVWKTLNVDGTTREFLIMLEGVC